MSRVVEKFKGQDYNNLVEKCKREISLFEDDDKHFNCDDIEKILVDKSLIRRKEDLKWLRPHKICEMLGRKPPELLVDGSHRFDINQGYLNDCYFLAALSVLADDEWAHQRVIPEGQSFNKHYVGMFRFRFYSFGKWEEVVIDDRLPVDNKGNLFFARGREKNEFWIPLTEKAYAKFYGSYSVLNMGGIIAKAAVDLTGGIPIERPLENPSYPENIEVFTSYIKKHHKQHAMFFTNIIADKSRHYEFKALGLVSNHAYSITGILKGEDNYLIRLRNPHGTGGIEWKGEWSDGSSNWSSFKTNKGIDDKTFKQLYHSFDKYDGEFFMSYKDFMKYFTTYTEVRMKPSKQSFNLFQWIESGIVPIQLEYLDKKGDPTIKFSIYNPDGKNDKKTACSVIISLQSNRKQSVEIEKISTFSLYYWNNTKYSWNKIDNKMMDIPPIVSYYTTTGNIQLKEGDYTIVPHHFARSNKEGKFQLVTSGIMEEFHLRVFIETNWGSSTWQENVNLIISAENLPKFMFFKSPSPYLIIKTKSSDTLYKTDVKYSSCNVEWKPFSVTFPDRLSKCKFEVYDETMFGLSQCLGLIGTFEASLDELISVKEFTIKDSYGNASGSITIKSLMAMKKTDKRLVIDDESRPNINLSQNDVVIIKF